MTQSQEILFAAFVTFTIFSIVFLYVIIGVLCSTPILLNEFFKRIVNTSAKTFNFFDGDSSSIKEASNCDNNGGNNSCQGCRNC
ncbi:hypothetical protein QM480_04220 [Flectobacillus sp. DC10W]|uniref:Uncharacterized protein n=1 Tax=Flectobacillus longus TaxID=2984207 RepID=A0ABT6YJ14_9BACT|nr:hypothetical protein [Flectobacillus longus]MDI9863515.1 hypothetical protein [Flectobacillus longus]